MTKKEVIKLIVNIVLLIVIYWLVVFALLVPIALFTTGLVTIVLSSFTGGIGIYVTTPILLRLNKIKFVKFDGKALFASFQLFFIGGAVNATCAILPWLGIATGGIGLAVTTIISTLVCALCAWFMTSAILSMYDM
ncbi:hypothetical protein HOS78_gp050 [Lactobacillus phage Bacchae]|uniref:Uncharacterized protein n=1 Tax=Lactobacillus phage Bacchae TaxID=2079429 RepID=A0A2K9VCQ9_9CAUD|nr:hypothetical protein HOS78_gp050 [Lactobacillus phage Bacchae]AUV59986.1 hypothetical protein [Lactobacillus phage Bacchae]